MYSNVEEIRCGPLPPLFNGYLEGGEQRGFGAVVVFRCLETMSHAGAPFAKCEESGQWSHTAPQCLAPCRVPSIESGTILGWNTSQMVLHGELVRVQCAARHEAEPESELRCHNGSWSHVTACLPRMHLLHFYYIYIDTLINFKIFLLH